MWDCDDEESSDVRGCMIGRRQVINEEFHCDEVLLGYSSGLQNRPPDYDPDWWHPEDRREEEAWIDFEEQYDDDEYDEYEEDNDEEGDDEGGGEEEEWDSDVEEVEVVDGV